MKGYLNDRSHFYFIDEALNIFGEILNGKLQFIENIRGSILNNIYRGRVLKINRKSGIVFIDIGIGVNGILNLKGENFHEGDSVIVEVKKENPLPKGPRLSSDYSVRGKYMVLLNGIRGVTFSSKLSHKERARLLKYNLFSNGARILYRTEAANGSYEELVEEKENLERELEALRLEENRLPTPKLLVGRNPIEDFFLERDDLEIVVNSKEYLNLKNSLYDEEFSVKYLPNVYSDFLGLFEREVGISGGSIVIEETAAMVVIDVNTGSFKGSDFEFNKIALREIKRQITLRNLSGIIMVDLIGVDEGEKRELLNFAQEEFKDDFSRTFIHGFTALGILELSRKNKGSVISKSVAD